MFDFPSNPTPGQEFVANASLTYVFSGMVWNRKPDPATVSVVAPVLTSLNPAMVTADGAAHTIRVMGSAFANNARLYIDNVGVVESFVNAGEITASVTAPTAEATDTFQVKNPALSNEERLVFATPPAAPQIISISPNSGWNTWTAVVVTVTGNSFVPQTKATWNGVNVDNTVYVSENQLTFTMDLSTVPLGANFVNVRTDDIDGTGLDQQFAVSY